MFYGLGNNLNNFTTRRTQELMKLKFLVPPPEFYNEKYTKTLMDYTSSPMIDRTETFKDCGYPNIIIEQKIPTTIINPGNFSDIVDETAKNIIQKSKDIKKPIAILYSGGLDSTCVTSAFLKQNCNITILGSKASIEENPEFYNEVLLNNKNVTLNIDNPLVFLCNRTDDFIFVTGECGAHLMGTINWTKYGGRENEITDYIEADDMASRIFKNPNPYFNVPDETKKLLLQILDKSPRSFNNNYDAQWWAIFALKWQFVAYRTQLWVGKLCPNLINFFMTEDFQHWALYNDVKVKCPDFEWRNYKMPIRDYIYSFFPNKSSSYDLPKRASFERTYRALSIRGRFVLYEPKQISFCNIKSKVEATHSIKLVK